MPSAGLSLVGFMEQQQAIGYLQSACMPANSSVAALQAEWGAAAAEARCSLPQRWPTRHSPHSCSRSALH